MPYATLEQIAHVLKLTPRMVNRHVKENGMPRISRGEYELVQCVHWYLDYLHKQIQDAKRGDETEQQARTRLTVLSADLKEIELAREQGKVVSADAVQATWAKMVVVFKTKILAIPTKLPQRLVACTSINESKELLSNALFEALNEISGTDIDLRGIPRVAEAGPGYAATGKPAAKADDQPVGGQLPATQQGVKRRARKVADRESGIPKGNDGRSE